MVGAQQTRLVPIAFQVAYNKAENRRAAAIPKWGVLPERCVTSEFLERASVSGRLLRPQRPFKKRTEIRPESTKLPGRAVPIHRDRIAVLHLRRITEVCS